MRAYEPDEEGTPPARHAAALFERVVANVESVVRGNPLVIGHAVTCLVAGGHLLIEDVPGVGKTSLGKALAASVNCPQRRIQFTADLLPSDLVGVSVFDRETAEFAFRPGPLFTNIVLADEINRTPPKTQSALLEVMEERHVTVDGTTYRLSEPFMVIATQNPHEHEGTFPLPLSQLDRFFMRVPLGYPEPFEEVGLLATHRGDDATDSLRPVAEPEDVLSLRESVGKVHCADSLLHYIVAIANATRSHPGVSLGMSPRATLALQRAARAWALLHGRDFVVPDDVKALALPVLGHRIELRKGRVSSPDQAAALLDENLSRVPVSDASHREL